MLTIQNPSARAFWAFLGWCCVAAGLLKMKAFLAIRAHRAGCCGLTWKRIERTDRCPPAGVAGGRVERSSPGRGGLDRYRLRPQAAAARYLQLWWSAHPAQVGVPSPRPDR